MIITPIKTDLVNEGDDLFEIISKNIKKLSERSVLAISAKILSICQGRVVEKKSAPFEKIKLIKKEADYYLKDAKLKNDIIITNNYNNLTINAAINECNANGRYILLPADLQNLTNNIWKFVKKYFSIKKVGVIITDSKMVPLKKGSVGTTLCYCGFNPFFDYKDQRDIFGRKLSLSKINIIESLGASTVLEMGEANEKQPLCIIQNINKIEFQNHVPNSKELKNIATTIKDDIFLPVLKNGIWKKGKNKKYK